MQNKGPKFRSKQNLFKTNKLSFSMGELVPLGWYSVLPGDILRGGTDMFTRVAPMDAPPLTPLELVIDTFYVPHSQIWSDSDQFHSGGAYGSTPPVHPTMNVYNRYGAVIPEGSLADMLGVTPGGTNTNRIVNALPFRAYNAIANRFFINDQLQSLLTNSVASGSDTTSNYNSIVVNWAKDYITGASPRAQKASSVLMEVERLTSAPGWRVYNQNTDTATSLNAGLDTDASGNLVNDAETVGLSLDPRGGLILNSSEVRDALMLQKYFENAEKRGSNRYVDYIADVFGVQGQDLRLQEPLRLSHTKDMLKFTEVLQTAGTTGGSSDGVGNYKGHGIGAVRANGYKQFIPEHGIVMILGYVRPKRVAWMQGMDREWFKTLKEHYFQTELAHNSQQAIQYREAYADQASPTGTLAYTNIYDEYRSGRDVVSGGFRSTYNYFHLDRSFSSDISFNSTLIECVPSSRIFQDTTADQFYSIAYHNVKAMRPIPASGDPLV